MTIYDKIGRANLYQHAKGGTIKPKEAKRFAIPIPSANIQRTGTGVVAARDQPAFIIAHTPKKALCFCRYDWRTSHEATSLLILFAVDRVQIKADSFVHPAIEPAAQHSCGAALR